MEVSLVASDRRKELPPALLPAECPQCEAGGAKQTKVKGRYVCQVCGADHDGGDGD